ncbi:hypothetical protein DL768_010961 [Monosporascus sp. mg162]|nr:hypothetical protein DL768_010961 [Monosporascus sp. mg162]
MQAAATENQARTETEAQAETEAQLNAESSGQDDQPGPEPDLTTGTQTPDDQIPRGKKRRKSQGPKGTKPNHTLGENTEDSIHIAPSPTPSEGEGAAVSDTEMTDVTANGRRTRKATTSARAN